MEVPLEPVAEEAFLLFGSSRLCSAMEVRETGVGSARGSSTVWFHTLLTNAGEGVTGAGDGGAIALRSAPCGGG